MRKRMEIQWRDATYIETRESPPKSSCRPTKAGKTCRFMAYCDKDKQINLGPTKHGWLTIECASLARSAREPVQGNQAVSVERTVYQELRTRRYSNSAANEINRSQDCG